MQDTLAADSRPVKGTLAPAAVKNLAAGCGAVGAGKAFAERNSKANLQRLANEFFALVDLAKVPEAVRTALAKGDHEAALNAYRDFFMNRLTAFSPDEKVNPGVRPLT